MPGLGFTWVTGRRTQGAIQPEPPDLRRAVGVGVPATSAVPRRGAPIRQVGPAMTRLYNRYRCVTPQMSPSAQADAEPVQADTFTGLVLIPCPFPSPVRHRGHPGIAAVVLLPSNNIAAVSMDQEAPWNALPTWFTALR